MPTYETNRRQVVRRLERDGWTNEAGGSHDKFTHSNRPDIIIVPRHRTLSIGVARSIAKLAGWTD